MAGWHKRPLANLLERKVIYDNDDEEDE